MNNSSTTVPPVDKSNAVAGFVLVPFFLLTLIGFTVAMVMYIQKRRRLDKLRHQLLPVYTYDPTEEMNEAEEELLLDSDEPKVVQGWGTSQQYRRTFFTKSMKA
ncbi:small integral membrane protein 29 [Rhincodon typus]|uniref:small integral membrane protein 29 n=1 Tax=Rhincodon typus TaxID=259920 RepID=UPI0009A40F3B|nr:small integral membrane protein 29 [Rhincodon typus]XP_048468087.1 small integral membrane protein 29 [Rhincodon typus]